MEIRNIISPNYNSSKKRPTDLIKIVVIHYTGMQSERESIKKLCNLKSKVSSHYLINRKGKIFSLVQDRHVAWHAGKSCWGSHKNLNENIALLKLSKHSSVGACELESFNSSLPVVPALTEPVCSKKAKIDI